MHHEDLGAYPIMERSFHKFLIIYSHPVQNNLISCSSAASSVCMCFYFFSFPETLSLCHLPGHFLLLDLEDESLQTRQLWYLFNPNAEFVLLGQKLGSFKETSTQFFGPTKTIERASSYFTQPF